MVSSSNYNIQRIYRRRCRDDIRELSRMLPLSHLGKSKEKFKIVFKIARISTAAKGIMLANSKVSWSVSVRSLEVIFLLHLILLH